MKQIAYGPESAQTYRGPVFNFHTMKSIQCISTYMFGKTTLLSVVPIPFEGVATYFYKEVLPFPIASNLTLRVVSCLEAFYERSYWKIAFDVASLASLYWIGPQASLVVDCASEATNLYLNYKMSGIVGTHRFENLFAKGEKDDLDCTVRANALQVLNVTEAEANDPAILQRKYEDIHKEWSGRIVKAANLKSLPVVDKLTILLNRVEKSYQTLQNGDHQN